MDIKHITSFLNKFTHLENKEKVIKQIVCETLYEKYGISTPINTISLQKTVLYITLSPTVKSSITIQKESILKDINTKLKTKFIITDIR